MIRIFFVSVLVSCLCVCAFAQDEYVDEYEGVEGIVFANLEYGLLEELLSDEEVKEAKGLVILGGKPQKEDFQFINEKMMDNLSLIDLRYADLDTIQSYAISGSRYNYKIICPLNLKHLCSHCFHVSFCDVYITGRFPTQDVNAKKAYAFNFFSTPENPYLTTYGSDFNPTVYSKNLDTLYFGLYYDGHIKGTKVLAGHVYEGQFLETPSFRIRESIDSIGDYAFSFITDIEQLYSFPSCRCFAPIPPKVGKNVTICNLEDGPFDFRPKCDLYVPDASVNLYKSNEFWGAFRNVRPMSEYSNIVWTNVEEVYGKMGLRISQSVNGYEFSSQEPMKDITFLNINGQKVLGYKVNERRFVVKKECVGEGVSICVVTFDNGHKEVVKFIN